jgi:hypothetical protein
LGFDIDGMENIGLGAGRRNRPGISTKAAWL